ncbi:hypothetical protein SRHO_G00214360 [Serrasalmus rhombeus]
MHGSLMVVSFNLQSEETKLVTQRNIDHALLNFVTHSLQPFSVVEQPAFKAFLHELEPDSSLMSRTTLMDEAALEMKRNVKKAMSDFIATTTDCWNARRRGFIGVTAHWVDPDSLERCSVALGYEAEDALTAEDEDVDGVEVDFVEVTAVLDEDDGLQFQLPKRHRCACHLLNLVSTGCSQGLFKRLLQGRCPDQHSQNAMHCGISLEDLLLQQRLEKTCAQFS